LGVREVCGVCEEPRTDSTESRGSARRWLADCVRRDVVVVTASETSTGRRAWVG
jgi:hypothetical protein